MRALLVVLVAVVALCLAPTVAESRTYVVHSTAYTPCSSGTIMADGTRTRLRSVANNFLPLGSKIRLVGRPGPYGLRIFYVRDRIGSGSQLDFWVPSCRDGILWGRRIVKFRVLRYGR